MPVVAHRGELTVSGGARRERGSAGVVCLWSSEEMLQLWVPSSTSSIYLVLVLGDLESNGHIVLLSTRSGERDIVLFALLPEL